MNKITIKKLKDRIDVYVEGTWNFDAIKEHKRMLYVSLPCTLILQKGNRIEGREYWEDGSENKYEPKKKKETVTSRYGVTIHSGRWRDKRKGYGVYVDMNGNRTDEPMYYTDKELKRMLTRGTYEIMKQYNSAAKKKKASRNCVNEALDLADKVEGNIYGKPKEKAQTMQEVLENKIKRTGKTNMRIGLQD